MDTHEELQAILKAVREFAESEFEPHAVTWDREKHFPEDVLRRAGALGLGGVWVQEEHGGSALDRLTGVHIFEQLAQGDPSLAAYLSIHNMVATMIDTYGTPAQRERWVEPLAAIEVFGSYCLTEPDVGSDAAALTTSARRSDDGYVLNGVKQFISGAGASQTYVVLARTDDTGSRGITAFLVDRDTPGLTFGANEHKMGWNAQPTRQVFFDDVEIAHDQRLGEEGQGFSIAMNALNGGRLSIAACSLGGAQWALDRTVAYLRTREAFGGPLIGQQALQFRLADMHTDLHAARCLLHDAATALDHHTTDAPTRCAMAKRFVTDAAFQVANEALQLHGGAGYLSEYGVEKIVRDLRVHQILEGTNEIMRLIISRSLIEATA